MIRDTFVGDDSIMLPITFDYRGGRSGNIRGTIIAAGVSTLLAVLFSVLVFLMKSKTLTVRFLYFFGILAVYTFFMIRFVFKQNEYKGYLQEIDKLNGEERDEASNMTSNSYWGIFDISEEYPYICSYVDGKRAIFVSLIKDIFVGRGDSVITEHYDAVADACNLAARLKVSLVSVDYMDAVGNDTRINSLYDELGRCTNPTLKSFVGSLYKGLIDDMGGEFASYDVYCIVANNKTLDLGKAMLEIVTQLLEGNYVAYKVLDEGAIRQLCATLTNNDEFSLLEAKDRVLRVNSFGSFKPLFFIDSKSVIHYYDENGNEYKVDDSEAVQESTNDDEEGEVLEDEMFDIF